MRRTGGKISPLFALPTTTNDLANFDWKSFFCSVPHKGSGSFSVVDPGSYFVGTLLTRSVFIHGRVSGFVVGEEVTVDSTGTVEATVFCRKLTVIGRLQGELFCDSALVLRTGELSGLLRYKRLKIQSGGIVKGSLSLRQKGTEAPFPSAFIEKLCG